MKIAITGGIGSGKSYVCRELERHGIAVYDCDAAAKRLMRCDEALRRSLISLVGEDVYQGCTLQKAVLASFLLASEENKQAVNEVVHPAVALDFERSGADWLESAILYDSGFIRRTHFDRVVCVTAPLSVRLERIMRRDHVDRQKAMAWIEAQMPQSDVLAMSDYEVVNDGMTDVAAQVESLLAKLSEE